MNNQQKPFNFLTVSEAEKNTSSSSLWVLNNSGAQGRQKGKINITIPEGNGQVHTIIVPVTFIPVDVTTQATKNAVLQNPQFRRLVQGKMLHILSDEHAESLLQNPDAQKEQQRLFSLGYEELSDMQDTAPTEVKDLINVSEGNIGGYALNLANNTDGNEDDLVSSLKSNANTLSKDELQYIVNTSTHAKVKTEAAKYLVK